MHTKTYLAPALEQFGKTLGGDIRYVVPPTKLLGGGHVPPGFGAY